MSRLDDVYARLQEKKKQRREIAKAFQDELKHDARHQELLEQLKTLKEEKKSIENRVKAESLADSQKLDTLALDINDDKEMLADIALTMYSQGEQVEIIDRENNRFEPVWSVAFKKTGSADPSRQQAVEAAGELEKQTA